MKNKLKFLSLIIMSVTMVICNSSKLHSDENMNDFLNDISWVMSGCYGLETIQSSGDLQKEEQFISFDFSADYIFSEAHAKRVVLDVMREINIRLQRSEELGESFPIARLDSSEMQITLKISPKKRHRIFPAIMFLDSIEKEIKEGSPSVNYVEVQGGKIKYFGKPNKLSFKSKLLSTETLKEAIMDVTGQNAMAGDIFEIPPIPKNDVIHTEFIFRRTWVAVRKKYGIKPMSCRRRCADKIELLDTGYEVLDVISKEEARNTLFLCINEMLHEIHIDDAIQPYLAKGFNESNLEVTLYLGGVGNKVSYPDIGRVHYEKGKITYKSNDPNHEWRAKERVKETFEEALTLVDKEKLDLKHISACSEHYK